MTTQEIEDALRSEIAVILSLQPSDIAPDRPLHDMGIDSMSFVEILLFIERTFNLKLIRSGLTREDFGSIQSLARRVERELKG